MLSACKVLNHMGMMGIKKFIIYKVMKYRELLMK